MVFRFEGSTFYNRHAVTVEDLLNKLCERNRVKDETEIWSLSFVMMAVNKSFR